MEIILHSAIGWRLECRGGGFIVVQCASLLERKRKLFFFFFFGAVGSSVPFGGGFFFLIFNFLNAPSVHVVGSPLVVFHVLVVGGALAVAQWSSHFSLALVVITALSCNEHFDVSAADTRHSISFGACVVDHGRKLASASVDEPVGNLIC